MIVGIDESNFSPSIAGDIVVCALVALEKVEGIKDSKTLSRKRRFELFEKLSETSVYTIALASPRTISLVNVYRGRNIAIETVLRELVILLKDVGFSLPDEVIIDGVWSEKNLNYFQDVSGLTVKGLARGDSTVYECSAASIIAKCYADILFTGYEKLLDCRLDCGNLSEAHIKQLREKGPTVAHRTGVYGKEWWNTILKGG